MSSRNSDGPTSCLIADDVWIRCGRLEGRQVNSMSVPSSGCPGSSPMGPAGRPIRWVRSSMSGRHSDIARGYGYCYRPSISSLDRFNRRGRWCADSGFRPAPAIRQPTCSGRGLAPRQWYFTDRLSFIEVGSEAGRSPFGVTITPGSAEAFLQHGVIWPRQDVRDRRSDARARHSMSVADPR